MTLPQLFHALLNALSSQPDGEAVDQLLADLAARSASQLHDTGAASLALACLQVSHPEPLLAADRLLRHYGFALTAKRHGASAHLVSLKRHAAPSAHPTASVIVHATTEGARAA